MSGYRDRTLRLDFPELADDCYVVIRNPLLVADDPDEWADLSGADRLRKRLARVVVSWNVWDAEQDEVTVLPLPTLDDPSPLDRIPVVILRRMIEEVARPFARSTVSPAPNGTVPSPPTLTEAGITPTS